MIEKIKNIKSKIWPIKPWILIIIALASGTIGIFGLRNNNLQMVKIRDQVFEADKKDAEIVERLTELKVFVFTHMNSSTRVELKYSYERAAEAAIKESSNLKTKQANIFDKVPAKCGGGARFTDTTDPCIKEYIDKRIKELGGQNSRLAKLPNKQLFIHEYKSPIVSFDFTGICLLIAGASGLTALGTLLVRFIKQEINFYEGGIDGL